MTFKPLTVYDGVIRSLTTPVVDDLKITADRQKEVSNYLLPNIVNYTNVTTTTALYFGM